MFLAFSRRSVVAAWVARLVDAVWPALGVHDDEAT
jgi:hypothetical protein